MNKDSGRKSGRRRMMGGPAPLRAALTACKRTPSRCSDGERLTMLNAMMRDNKHWNPCSSSD